MMIDPPINELLDKVDCRYTLVVMAAKRARQLVSGDAPLAEQLPETQRPVAMAIEEIYEDKISYERLWEGNK